MYFIQNGQQIGRAVKGIDGNAVRCDKWEENGLLYYKYYYSKDFEGQYSGLTAVDEWEHRSSIYDKYYDEYLEILNDHNVKYDAYGIEVANCADEYATEKVRKEFEQGFQGWEYKFNTVGSSRGDYPFIAYYFSRPVSI